MVDYFVAEESRLFIFEKPLICSVCLHDVFIPYETYRNVEKPGIKVIFTHNTAICQRCGFVMEFVDPSRYDAATDVYHEALNQQFIHKQPDKGVQVPVLDEEEKAAQIKCIYVALKLLIRHNVASETLMPLFHEGNYIGIMKFFNPSYECKHSHMAIVEILATLLLKIRENTLIDTMRFDRIHQFGSYEELEAFLTRLINEE